MNRGLIGAGIGFLVGLLLLGSWGAYYGFTEGDAMRRIPPGLEAAGSDALTFLAYFWWLAGFLGAGIGGLAGLGSWAVRPRGRACRPT